MIIKLNSVVIKWWSRSIDTTKQDTIDIAVRWIAVIIAWNRDKSKWKCGNLNTWNLSLWIVTRSSAGFTPLTFTLHHQISALYWWKHCNYFVLGDILLLYCIIYWDIEIHWDTLRYTISHHNDFDVISNASNIEESGLKLFLFYNKSWIKLQT